MPPLPPPASSDILSTRSKTMPVPPLAVPAVPRISMFWIRLPIAYLPSRSTVSTLLLLTFFILLFLQIRRWRAAYRHRLGAPAVNFEQRPVESSHTTTNHCWTAASLASAVVAQLPLPTLRRYSCPDATTGYGPLPFASKTTSNTTMTYTRRVPGDEMRGYPQWIQGSIESGGALNPGVRRHKWMIDGY